MKNIKIQIIALVLIVATAVSCNNSSKKNNSKADNNSIATESVTAKEFSITPIVNGYLNLQNALVADDSKKAAEAGKQLLETLKSVDMSSIPSDKHKKYMQIADDAKENSEHISKNGGNIPHQREHFEFLTKDLENLIALFGTPQKLYLIHCPMYNDGKGADWISNSKQINNPYLGQKMPDCGKVQKELK